MNLNDVSKVVLVTRRSKVFRQEGEIASYPPGSEITINDSQDINTLGMGVTPQDYSYFQPTINNKVRYFASDGESFREFDTSKAAKDFAKVIQNTDKKDKKDKKEDPVL